MESAAAATRSALDIILSNQLITGSLFFFVSGVVSWLALVVQQYIRSRVLESALTKVVIRDRCDAFQWIVFWLSRNSEIQKNGKRVELKLFQDLEPGSSPHNCGWQGQARLKSRRRACNVTFVPDAEWKYKLKFRGSTVWVELKCLKKGGYIENSCEIQTLGEGKELVAQLVAEAHELYDKSLRERTEILLARSFGVGGGSHWGDAKSRPSRPLSSVVMPKGLVHDLLSDLREFLGGEEWYTSHGVPYRRGYMLYGAPGTGKSSLIFALAGELHLPICVVGLASEDMTDANLLELLSTAPKPAILLLEDVDAAFRSCATSSSSSDDGSSDDEAAAMARRSSTNKGVTMSGLLNAIDGVAGQEGSVLFLTTNHVEKLDPALVRPGRVDVKVELLPASRSSIERFFSNFYSGEGGAQELAKRFAAQLPDGVLTMATVQGFLMQHHRHDAKGAVVAAPRIMEARDPNLLETAAPDKRVESATALPKLERSASGGDVAAPDTSGLRKRRG